MKILGVVGGLGPLATACFMRRCVEMTDAESDQEHLEIALLSRPSTPDRTAYILDCSQPNPLPALADAVKTLEGLGAGCIAIPCVTAHYFFDALQQVAGVPILNALEEAALCLQREGVSKVGILATEGTIRTGLLQKAFAHRGITSVMPDWANQRRVMDIIYRHVKAGRPVDAIAFAQVSDGLWQKGCQQILLGCTELSVVRDELHLDSRYLDVLDVLARASVLACGARLKSAYKALVGGKEGEALRLV
ncbi:aspartate/glutamate racemase family protein [Bittarella massiliensis (ex Durand et al. 2017)]|uniref:aspartate/glutamate racemase family protein n=1 Tax=Bittarella massiliensis (ex Durand et al. 2017) TaxID=1720313 RepID=UPI001AA0D94C|nr:amino acid racemase [Bittarella massiliensis (ex Durand et al. 2017)]MBO1680246.1 amino acid racemase [Bittarella massiliensis (ex Durand et al. 2017)]